MYTIYRTATYGTAAKNILYGEIYDRDKNDIVINKNYSLEFMRIQNTHNEFSNNNILKSTFEQQAFGNINDTKLLDCHFEDQFLYDQQQGNNIIIAANSPIKDIEDEDDNLSEPKEPIQYTQHTRIGHSPIQGNSVIVIVSEYGQLMFCTVVGEQNNLTSTGRFECLTEIKLDDPGMEFNKINKKLAIDPQSRAIAVSSFVDRVDVMLLNEKMSRHFFSPVSGLVTINELGIIWGMEFLYTEPSSPDRILLAIVVYNDTDKTCRIPLYNINASDPSKPEVKLIGRLPLDKNTPLPLLLIPLRCHPEYLMLITKQTVCVLNADDIVSGNVLYSVDSLIDIFDGKIEEEQICTSYSFSADPKAPIVYLGTASGNIIKVDISSVILISYKIIYRGNPIGEQMCMLGTIQIQDENKKSFEAEILFYIGESADSEIIAINTENDNDCFVLQNFLNRSPTIDSQLHQEPGLPDRIVTCSGQGEHGSLHHLSYNIDTSTTFISENDWDGITKLWYICESNDNFHLVASSFYDTRMAHFVSKNATGSKLLLETNAQTVFSYIINSKYPNQFFVQILQDHILIFNFNTGDTLLRHTIKLGYNILFATIWEDQDEIFFFLCISNGELYSIQIYTLDEWANIQNLKLRTEASLQSSPSSLNKLLISELNENIISIGTYDSTVLLYQFNQQQYTLNLYQKINCNDIPHSTAIVGAHSHTAHLFIGTRNGNILTTPISVLINASSKSINADNQYDMGSYPVQLSSNKDGTAFALCQSVWYIQQDDKLQYIFEHVNLPDATNVTAAISLEDGDSILAQQQNNCYRLAVVANRKLYLLKLEDDAHLLTKKKKLTTTPRKILLHDQSVSYLASTSKIRGKHFYEIDLIDKDIKSLCNLRFEIGEEIRCLSKWEVVNKGKTYHYICVGIENSPRHELPKTIGSLYLYRLKAIHHDTNKRINISYTLRLAWSIKHINGGGVRAICSHPSGLLFSSGNVLHLHQLDIDKGELVEITHKVLRFPITSIHVAGDRICVTCETESVSFYKYDDASKQLEFLNSDPYSRTVYHSLLLDDHTVVGVSLSGGMFALKEPLKTSFEKESLQTLFCFHYPDIIIRPYCAKYRIQHSTEYKTGLLSDHILPWKKESLSPKINDIDHINQNNPLLGCTISGGMIVSYRCTRSLYMTLDELQYRLLYYAPTQPLLGSTTNYLTWYLKLSGPQIATLHGDYLQLFLRLNTKQQYEVIGYLNNDRKHDKDENDERENGNSKLLSMLDVCLEFYRDTISRRKQESNSVMNIFTFDLWPSYPSQENELEIANWITSLIVHILSNLERYYY
ncbi:unnamed protein product [Cunninghamella blakesleeana]